MYVEFHARSAFSFLEGATLPEDLISVCAQHQMPAMALLDRDGLYGSPRFYLSAERAGLKAHIGAEVSCEALPEQTRSPQRHRDTENFFKDCHPERNEAGVPHPNGAFFATLGWVHERSEGPAFPPRTPPPSTNLQSET